MNLTKAQEIKCNVKNCRHHDKNHHCTLSNIEIGKTVVVPTEKSETDCMNFETL